MLRILDTGVAVAKENMTRDGDLLEQMEPEGSPLLHFYDWERPSATYGYFVSPSQYLDLEKAAERKVDLAKRPTGGGIVFHIWDLAFSFLMPSKHPAFSLNTLHNYAFVNEAILEAVSTLFLLQEPATLIPESVQPVSAECQNFCMARPTQYDVVYRGLKIAGAAQRKRRQGYLHQGTISLALPQIDLLRAVLLPEGGVLESMLRYTFAPLGESPSEASLKEARFAVREKIIQKLTEKLYTVSH